MEVVKVSFSGKTDQYFIKNNLNFKLSYKDNHLYLTLLSGAGHVKVDYTVRVRRTSSSVASSRNSLGNPIQPLEYSGKADIEFQESIDLNINVNNIREEQLYSINTELKLQIIASNPLVEVPQQSTLSANLAFMLKSDDSFNNVKLYLGPEKEEVSANKFMLAARSSVFKTMFQSGMKEAQSNEVEIPDISVAVGKEMLTYIYTDQVPNLGIMTEDLLCAAEKYQLLGLKALCESKLIVNLDVSNAAHYLLLADRYCSETGGIFKEHVLSFITQSMETFSSVRQSEEWQEVKKFPELAYAAYDKFASTEPPSKRPKQAIL